MPGVEHVVAAPARSVTARFLPRLTVLRGVGESCTSGSCLYCARESGIIEAPILADLEGHLADDRASRSRWTASPPNRSPCSSPTHSRAAAADGRLRSGDRLPSTRALADSSASAAPSLRPPTSSCTPRAGSPVGTAPAPTSPPTPPGPLAASAPQAPPRHRPSSSSTWRRARRGRVASTRRPGGGRGGPRPTRCRCSARSAEGCPSTARSSPNTCCATGASGARWAREEPVLATGGTTAALTELAAAAVLKPRRRGGRRGARLPARGRALRGSRRCGWCPRRSTPRACWSTPCRRACAPSTARPRTSTRWAGGCPRGRRVALVERARRDGWLVIEDDYDGELRYDVAPLPLLAALAPDVVVHLGTTSKILTPTLGAGWMVAPERIAAAVLAHRDRTGTSPARRRPAGARRTRPARRPRPAPAQAAP